MRPSRMLPQAVPSPGRKTRAPAGRWRGNLPLFLPLPYLPFLSTTLVFTPQCLVCMGWTEVCSLREQRARDLRCPVPERRSSEVTSYCPSWSLPHIPSHPWKSSTSRTFVCCFNLSFFLLLRIWFRPIFSPLCQTWIKAEYFHHIKRICSRLAGKR